MLELTEKTAVVTGAASGIGLGLAQRFAEEGMNVVLADIEAPALDRAEADLRERGARTLARRTDVADPAAVAALADAAFSEFGAVHVLCNNAGVSLGDAMPAHEFTLDDWHWLLGINLFGVIYGVHAFVPRMIRQREESWVVNTASGAGLIASMGLAAPYAVSKHAVVALSECLFQEMAATAAPVRVAVLCPAWVRTRILDCERNRPGGGRGPTDFTRKLQPLLETGKMPSEVAAHVVDAMREQRFYVLPHPGILADVERRFEGVRTGRPTVASVLQD